MNDISWISPIAGLLVGIVIGAVARRARFCTLAALERYWYADESAGVRSWALAATVAAAATQAMAAFGLVDLSGAIYLTPSFGWAGAILGGLMFGFGMALVGTCGFGALVRLGGGNLRAFVVLVILGLSALAAQRGPIGHLRTWIVDDLALDLSAAGDQSLGAIVSALLGMDARFVVAAVIVVAALIWIFRDPEYRRRRDAIAGATLVGLAIAAGWPLTYWIGQHAFEPVQMEAGSFVAPVGDFIMHFATYTGELPRYGVGMVAGVALGAALVAWRHHDVRWEACDDARELSRHIGGAFLMGTGGVFALGCTVGQGISAASLLAVSTPIVVASIVVGARLGLAYLLEGSIRGALGRAARPAAE